MPKKKEFDPTRFSSRGVWLDQSTLGIRRADQTTFEALKYGLQPEELRLLRQLDAEALSFQEDLHSVDLLFKAHPNAGNVEELLKAKAKILKQQPRTETEKSRKTSDK